MFVRITLLAALAIVAGVVLILLLKLLFVAAIVAALGVGLTLVIRGVRRRLAPRRMVRVTGLTARH